MRTRSLPFEKTSVEALAAVRSGQHVLLGSGAACPDVLVDALAARAGDLYDVELLHLLTLGKAPYADPKYAAEEVRDRVAFWKGVKIEP